MMDDTCEFLATSCSVVRVSHNRTEFHLFESRLRLFLEMISRFISYYDGTASCYIGPQSLTSPIDSLFTVSLLSFANNLRLFPTI